MITERIENASPRATARIAGAFYLMVFLTGIVALLVSEQLVKSGNAEATAANLLSHESLFWLGFAVNVMATIFYVAVTALFYQLFEAVNRSLSLLAAFFSLVGCAVGAVSCIFYLTPLVVLKNTQASSALSAKQLQALAFLFIRLFGRCGNIGLVFFGCYCLLIGSLILKSAFLPRALGVLMTIAGIGWLTFLWPPLANYLSPWNLLPGILGEGSLTLWLLVMGVNAQRWKEQAGGGIWDSPSTLRA